MQSRKLSRFFTSSPPFKISLCFLNPYPAFFPCLVPVLLTRLNSTANFHELLHWAMLSWCLAGLSSCCLWPGSPSSDLSNRRFSEVHRPIFHAFCSFFCFFFWMICICLRYKDNILRLLYTPGDWNLNTTRLSPLFQTPPPVMSLL